MSNPFESLDPQAFRRKRNLWFAYASEAFAPVLSAGARLAAKGTRSEPRQWRRGLILSHTHIGDVLYRTCSLKALGEALPRCEWTYAASPGSAEALRNNPYLCEVLPVVAGENSWQLTRGGFATLARRQFDVVLCSNTLRHYPDLFLAARLGIPNRVAFTNKGFSGLITHPVRYDFPDSYPSYFRTMVAAVCGSKGDWALVPELYPGGSDDDLATALWEGFRLDSSSGVVACALKTRQASGNWPHSVLLDVLIRARAQRRFDVVLCGAPGDANHLNEIAATLPFPARVLAGEADVLTFAAFLGKCSALLTLDSGPRHIGNAMKIPVIFARNLSHSMKEAGRYTDLETDLAPDAEYLADDEVERVTRALSTDAMANVLLDRISEPIERA